MAPPALSAGHALHFVRFPRLSPTSPRMRLERILAIRLQKFHQFFALCCAEAGTDPNMLEIARIVIQSQKQRAYQILISLLVPAEASHDTVTISLVLHLEHHALVGFIRTRHVLGHDAIKPRSFK